MSHKFWNLRWDDILEMTLASRPRTVNNRRPTLVEQLCYFTPEDIHLLAIADTWVLWRSNPFRAENCLLILCPRPSSSHSSTIKVPLPHRFQWKWTATRTQQLLGDRDSSPWFWPKITVKNHGTGFRNALAAQVARTLWKCPSPMDFKIRWRWPVAVSLVSF